MNSLTVLGIIFRFGEHYYQGEDSSIWWQLTLSSVGAFIGFGFSLWLYYRQTKRGKKKEAHDQEKNQLELLSYYSELLQTIEKDFARQLELVDEFINSQSEDLTDLKTLGKVATNDFVRLKNIDNQGVFQAWTASFHHVDTIQEYRKTNSSLDYIEGTIDEIFRIYFSNSKDCVTILHEVKKIIDQRIIPTLISTLGGFESPDGPQFQPPKQAKDWIHAHLLKNRELNEEGASMEIINQKFLEPLLIQYSDQFSHYPEASTILMYCRNARVRLTDVKREVSNIINQFGKVRSNCAHSSTRIRKTIEKIEELVK
jgi:hypothetical protein